MQNHFRLGRDGHLWNPFRFPELFDQHGLSAAAGIVENARHEMMHTSRLA